MAEGGGIKNFSSGGEEKEQRKSGSDSGSGGSDSEKKGEEGGEAGEENRSFSESSVDDEMDVEEEFIQEMKLTQRSV